MTPMIMLATEHGVKRVNGEELIKHITYNMYTDGNGEKAKCFTFHRASFAPTFYDTSEEVSLVMKDLRKYKKQGIIVLRECNLIESRIGKMKIYGFVSQHCDAAKDEIDIIACSLGIRVTGCVYWFFNTENRDNMYTWLNK
jgi:hypothetical protein